MNALLMTPPWLLVLHWLAGLIVLAEALNKLERVDLRRPGCTGRERCVDALKALAWGLLALGGAGVVVGPLLSLPAPGLADVCTALGFAVLILKTRFKEG